MFQLFLPVFQETMKDTASQTFRVLACPQISVKQLFFPVQLQNVLQNTDVHKKNKCLVAYAVDTVTVEYCLKYSSYFTVKNLPQPLRQSSFFNISWSNLCDYPHDTGLIAFISQSYFIHAQLPFCTLCQQHRLFAHAVPGSDPTRGQVRSKRLLLASLGFGSGLLLLALSVVASVTQLFALSTSVLLGDQSDDHRCYAAEKHTIQTRIFFFF